MAVMCWQMAACEALVLEPFALARFAQGDPAREMVHETAAAGSAQRREGLPGRHPSGPQTFSV